MRVIRRPARWFIVTAGASLALAVLVVLLLPAFRSDSVSSAASRGERTGASTQAIGTADPPGNWVTSWGAAPQPPSPLDSHSGRGFHNVTLREVVFLTTGGSAVRVRFTNAYGTQPVEIGRASIGVAAPGGALVSGTVRQMTFNGQASTVMPVGAETLSDPVALDVSPLTRLAISLYLPDATGPVTEHYESHETNYEAGGSHILDASATPFDRELGSWYLLDDVDVAAPARVTGAVVALGDSITAGVNSAPNADATYPDDLARRLLAGTGEALSVINEGIGGNRILNNASCCGANALARFLPDVVNQEGVRAVILLEGINDIGYSLKTSADTKPHTNVSAAQIIAGDEQIIDQAHADGLRIFGATLLPFKGSRIWSAGGEAKREAVNAWILHSGAFDGVIDFASALADPSDPERLNPAFDSGDHLHPNDRGYQAMANAVDLNALLGSGPASGPGATTGSGATSGSGAISGSTFR